MVTKTAVAAAKSLGASEIQNERDLDFLIKKTLHIMTIKVKSLYKDTRQKGKSKNFVNFNEVILFPFSMASLHSSVPRDVSSVL